MNSLVDVFDDPEKKVDELLKKRTMFVPKSEGLQKIYDNIRFSNVVKEAPLMLKKTYRGHDFKTIDLSNFLNLRLYPRSIYTTDKLLRLVASSRYEQLKKHIAKKRSMPFNMLWIILIIFGVVIAIVSILVLLPKFTGG